MKKIFISILMLMPLMAMAQSNWEIPQEQLAELSQDNADQKKAEAKAKAKKEKAEKKAKSKEADLPYLAGAVPEVDGKIVFTLDLDVPGKSAAEIYDMTYAQLAKLTKDENQTEVSKIALINKEEHSIVATCNEWLVFSNKLLMLDRTLFSYVVNAKCFDGKLHVTFERLIYNYEMERKPEYYRAEEIIRDKDSVSKDGKKLKRGYIKFRKKTVDRMNEVMDSFRESIK